MLNLVPDWKLVLKHAWSVRLMVLAALLSGLEVAVPFLDGLLPVSPGVFALLAFGTTIAAFIARFIAQKHFEHDEGPAWDTGEPK